MAEYGLIKETTLQAIAAGLRNKEIIPKYGTGDLVLKYKSGMATSLTDPTPIGEHLDNDRIVIDSVSGASNYEIIIDFDIYENPETTDTTSWIADVSYDFQSIRIFRDTPSPITCTMEADTVFTNAFTFNANVTSAQRDWFGAVVTVYPLDASGNRMQADDIEVKYTPAELVEGINAYVPSGGGGGEDLPEEAFNITGVNSYKFANDCWSWFVNAYGSRITTNNISNLVYFCSNSKQITRIPFVLNLYKEITQFDNAFSGCSNLIECPKIRAGELTSRVENRGFSGMLNNCEKIRDFNDLFEPEFFDFWEQYKVTSQYSTPKPPNFYNCYSMRSIPNWWYKLRLNPESTAFPYQSYTAYYNFISGAYALDEVLNIPVWTCGSVASSNLFNGTVSGAKRLKNFTFETNPDGSAKKANWKSQVLDFSATVGWGTIAHCTGYNSGITADKEVKDDATYQALKNDPDWFATRADYCRYNHDSAVTTINSLPDTSECLASAGGTNTIKFKGTDGSKTDGGAINTLTAEEIAVAAAKGWTVTLS